MQARVADAVPDLCLPAPKRPQRRNRHGGGTRPPGAQAPSHVPSLPARFTYDVDKADGRREPPISTSGAVSLLRLQHVFEKWAVRGKVSTPAYVHLVPRAPGTGAPLHGTQKARESGDDASTPLVFASFAAGLLGKHMRFLSSWCECRGGGRAERKCLIARCFWFLGCPCRRREGCRHGVAVGCEAAFVCHLLACVPGAALPAIV